MDFSSGITAVNSVSRRTSVVSSVNHNKRVLFGKKKRYQNTGITQDALRYSSSRSNRKFALLEIILENVITTPQGSEIEISTHV